MWVFPLYIHAKLKRKNAILVHSPLFFIYKLFLYTPQGRAYFVRSVTLCKQQSPNRCRCANFLFCLSFIARSCNFMSNKSSNFAPKCKLRNEQDCSMTE